MSRGSIGVGLLLVGALALGVAATASAQASTSGSQATENVTLRHGPTGFSAKAPSGYRLKVRPGVYRIIGARLTVTVRILRTGRGARALGKTLAPTGDRVLAQGGNRRSFRLLADGSGLRTSIRVSRRGRDLVVTTGVYPRGSAALARIAKRIAASVRGGLPKGVAGGTSPGTTPPAPATGRLVPLKPYRAPDGGATAWVPSDPDWTISSTGGALEGSSPRGSFLLGQTFSINLPGTLPPGPRPPTLIEYPFVSAADALQQVWPLINQGNGINMTNVRIRALIGDATIPTFRSSGMLIFDYQVNGVPFVGVANIATEDRLSQYSNFFWQLYISVIAVPAAGDPTVGAALRLVWRSWNPSGAIAQRTQQARQILTEINETWKSVAEFRSRTADQQSRDVSCLLRTGPFIDDNARELGLPPLLDCDSTYVRTT